jgi:hypothetical protein
MTTKLWTLRQRVLGALGASERTGGKCSVAFGSLKACRHLGAINPRGSRIIAVADVVEDMASDKPYRLALGVDVALKEIESGRGTASTQQLSMPA